MRRLLVPAAALLWGLQFAFLVPSIALLLSALYHASTAQVGSALTIDSIASFVIAMGIPAWADRKASYLPWMVVASALTVANSVMLWFAHSLTTALVSLVLLAAPATVGMTMLMAYLRHAGYSNREVINTRAIVSFAWVAGPPVATFVMEGMGERAILPLVGAVGVASALVTLAMMTGHRRPDGQQGTARAATAPPEDATPVRWGLVGLLVVVWVLLQATNGTATSVMNLFVVDQLHLPLYWGGIALAVAAGAEVPAMLVLGRLLERHSSLALTFVGCLMGIAYYVLMFLVRGPVMLVALQVLNAAFFAIISGVGLTIFQDVIPRPGLATGLYTNTRRIVMTLGSDASPVVGRSQFLAAWRLFADAGNSAGPLVITAVTAVSTLGAAAVVLGGLSLAGAAWLRHWLLAPDPGGSRALDGTP